MIGESLAYVALVSRDPPALTSLLGEQLGLAQTDLQLGANETVPVFTAGQSVLAVLPVGHAFVEGEERPGVHHIGLGVADVDAAAAQAEAIGIGVGLRDRPALGGGSRRELSRLDLAGVRTWLTPPICGARNTSSVIQRIDHVGIASADNAGAVDAWVSRLGHPLESQQTDMEVAIAVESFTSDRWGVVYHTRPPVPVGGLRVSFITAGDTELEFLENFNPDQGGQVDHGSVGNTRQDQGAIAKYVASRGAGLHHLAFKTSDIDHTLASLARVGVALIDKKGRPGSRRGRIGFIHPKATGGVLLHFVERPGA